MSILVHHCRTCEHPESHHLPRADTPADRLDFYDRGASTGAAKSCRCCGLGGSNRDIDPEPTVHETRTFPGGQIEPMSEPGSIWNSGTTHRQRLCNCGACRSAYELA